MTPPVDLSKLKVEELKRILDNIDFVFSDCDGVLWHKKPLPGSGEFINLIQKLGKTVHFVSNNSLRTMENYDAMFTEAGIANATERLTIPSVAIAEFLKSKNFNKHVYCVASTETIRMLEKYGFKCKYGPETCVDYYQDFVQYLENDPEIGAVVFDSDFKVNLAKLYKAETYLRNREVFFINGASDRLVPFKPGTLGIGPGKFTDMVAEHINREPLAFGKPGKPFGEFAMKRAGAVDPSRVLFIGDMLQQDIGLGKAVGFKTLLVLTSVSLDDAMSKPDLIPDYYVSTLGDLVPKLKEI